MASLLSNDNRLTRNSFRIINESWFKIADVGSVKKKFSSISSKKSFRVRYGRT
jgi:hypothetical protein